MLHALTGISYSNKLNQFSIAPKVNPNNFQSFFITNSSWGTVNQRIIDDKVAFTLSISFGEILLKSINLVHNEINYIKEILNCEIINSENEVIKIESKLKVSSTTLEVFFLRPVTLKENLKLQFELK